MNYSHISEVILCNDRLSDELYSTCTLVNATRTSCQFKEFNGEYYGIPQSYVKKISDERNEYLSLLDLISDKIGKAYKINLNLEDKLSHLQKDTNDSCRHVAAQCSDNQGS